MHTLAEEFQSLPPVFNSVFRPSIVLRPIPASESELALGESRMGGRPDLPADMEWPQYEGKHLVFVAQFALGDLGGWAQMMGLPAAGHLYFFHDQDHTWELGPKQEGFQGVIYSPASRKDLHRADFPADIAEGAEHQCPLCKIERHPLQQNAPPWAPIWQSTQAPSEEDLLAINDYNTRLFDHLRGTLGWPEKETEPWHALGGFPTKLVQDPVEWECQSYVCEMSDEEFWELPAEDGIAFEEQQKAMSQDWVQLLQCDYDETTGTCWSDMGMLCYMIRKQDLAALAFDRVVAIMQSH
ncbi:DUF1963 domain-containing protein [Prosthecobacter sp.]|uniref:DUF1963 domain-containing protein n=1 Tax=Prosthecobacter sp. TaxID=1965333 RepID=UPI0037834474